MTKGDWELGEKIEMVNKRVDDVIKTWTTQLATHYKCNLQWSGDIPNRIPEGT